MLPFAVMFYVVLWYVVEHKNMIWYGMAWINFERHDTLLPPSLVAPTPRIQIQK